MYRKTGAPRDHIQGPAGYLLLMSLSSKQGLSEREMSTSKLTLNYRQIIHLLEGERL